jgi:hypothetical protein
LYSTCTAGTGEMTPKLVQIMEPMSGVEPLTY